MNLDLELSDNKPYTEYAVVRIIDGAIKNYNGTCLCNKDGAVVVLNAAKLFYPKINWLLYSRKVGAWEEEK